MGSTLLVASSQSRNIDSFPMGRWKGPNVAWLSRVMQRKKQPLSSLFFPSRARVAVDRARWPSRRLSRDWSFLWS